MNIYPKFPSEEEWQKVIDSSGRIKNLSFCACCKKDNKEFSDSLQHFNDKLGKIRISYYFLQYYYNLPGSEELFQYYVENFYIRFFSVWEFIYHLANEFYRFWVDSDGRRGFKGDVIRRLSKTDRVLNDYLKRIEQEHSDFMLAKKYRNSIVHQIFPGEPAVELVRMEWNGELRTQIKEAVSPAEFVKNIGAAAYLLSETLDLLEKEFDDHDCDIKNRG